ncbi:hypothetical protein AGR6A_Cc50101 [Agrobacterium sp. NCPPB 925]|nr:hypothetical protein AGR6A_Cc50101 [Agrobacterium sp. NCPPB 925]
MEKRLLSAQGLGLAGYRLKAGMTEVEAPQITANIEAAVQISILVWWKRIVRAAMVFYLETMPRPRENSIPFLPL